MTAAPELLSAGSAGPPPGGLAEQLRTADGVRLRVGIWPSGGRGLAIVSPGRAEFIEKHYETVSRLQALGFAAMVIDWRGQGLSERLLADRRRGYVRDFSDFQLDLDAALARAETLDAAAGERLLLAHSMGGAIAARALMRRDRGKLGFRFDHVVFSAPMLKLARGPLYRGAARVAAEAMAGAGRAQEFTPGAGPETLAEAGFSGNLLTHDPKRFASWAGFLRAHPDLALGGPTWGWLRAAMREMSELRPTRQPVNVVVGAGDPVVSPQAAADYAEGSGGETLTLESARHEPLMEGDEIQAQVWRFIADKLGPPRDAAAQPSP